MATAPDNQHLVERPDEPLAPRFCPQCGFEHAEGAAFCGNCGQPLTVAGVTAPQAAQRYGGFWIRVAASLMDWTIFSLSLAVITGVSGITGTDLALVLGLTIWWLYNALMESSAYQATLGKRVLGLRVTDDAGNRISFGRASCRLFSKFASTIILYVGFLMVGFTDRHRGLHDMMAGTLVERIRQ